MLFLKPLLILDGIFLLPYFLKGGTHGAFQLWSCTYMLGVIERLLPMGCEVLLLICSSMRLTLSA